jgi:hypothetical protein
VDISVDRGDLQRGADSANSRRSDRRGALDEDSMRRDAFFNFNGGGVRSSTEGSGRGLGPRSLLGQLLDPSGFM